MPLPKRPHVASAEQVRISRDGDTAIIEYADATVATTYLRVGPELAAMSDDDVLELWNGMPAAGDAHRARFRYTAKEVPVGRPQIEHFERDGQWTPRGNVLRCQVLVDSAMEPALDEPFVSIDGIDLTLGEFMSLISTHAGWGMRIEFVPHDEMHRRPRLRVREPRPARAARPPARERTRR